METNLDKFGRVVIPKQIRDDLGLEPGEPLNIEKREHEIILKPSRMESHILSKDGVLVFSGTATGDIMKAVNTHRNKRLKDISLQKKR